MLTPWLRPSIVLPRAWGTPAVLRRPFAVRLGSTPLPDLALRFVMAVLAGVILTASATHTPSIRLDRSTPAWDRVTRDIRAQGMGNCYHAAVTLAMNARALGLENVSVVQGTLMGTGALEGVRFGHSWVEADVPGGTTRVVLDYSSGDSLVMDRDIYRSLQQARDVHEYGVAEARILAAGGDYGPWTTDVLHAWHP